MRLLTLADVPACCSLSAAAGWNQTPADWERMITLEPVGCFCIEADEHIVATTTLLTYGRDLAWVGMVLTHADYQRRGYARLLVTAALELAAVRGIQCVKLDATDQGRPLYESLGFVDEQPIERWQGRPDVTTPNGAEWGPSPLYQLDLSAFGADRSRFLNTLGKSMIRGGAFAMCRPGAKANHLGPCTARDQESAARVIRSVVATKPGEPWLWDILPANEPARSLAEELGFQPMRHLMRMYRGKSLRGAEHMVYAIAGFEAG
jgi:GNAT superfamily N-acetyltransferase